MNRESEAFAHSSATGEALEDTNRAGHIETRGLDFIPGPERLGRPFELFWVWMGGSVNYLSFAFGGLLILIGLSVWEAVVVTIIGNLWWIAVGWLSVSGPASGTPSVTVMRAMFGIRGNRVFGAGQGLVIGLFYEVINIVVATFASLALLDVLGLPVPAGIEWVVLLVVAFLSFVLSIYGHATIVTASPYFSAALAVAFVALAVFVMQAADFSYEPTELAAAERWPTLLLGYAIVSSGPLSWGTGADYSRYLPENASKHGVLWWTALGGFIPTVFISLIGIFAATAIDMTDPQLAIGQIVPGWFTPVFLCIVVVGSITNNALVSYSAGLSAQGIGVRVHRVTTVIVTGLIATLASFWLAFMSPGFLETMEYALELTVTILGPLIAIYAVDILLRRNNYNGLALNDERRGSPFWYSHGVFWPGVSAQVIGTVIAIMMSNTTLYTGPIAAAMGGADLSAILGPVIGGAIYALLWFTTKPFKNPRLRPGAVHDIQMTDATASADNTMEVNR
ncbi:purine-cytosine permease family protein [Paeniglutamicibacter kerguelensis]|uniref:Purine-cytosine permease-like protein n=1 Tax=Paeniglutamicibacter kerguelensis TaxID=254788 RepID=A0ABS4XM03_9MICC|nr:cytosine permease [Paeniglutamicibacter kerguelensis]MBP2388689.1 purine-cytosine permease-like protein [Paeniglutamicibacter kerguelensis]